MPNPIARLAAGLKSLVYPGGATLPGSTPRDVARRDGYSVSIIPDDAFGGVRRIAGGNPDAARAGPTWENSCVAIGLNWVVDQFPRADLKVEERGDGDSWAPVRDDPLVALLSDPTPEHGAYDFHGLWAGALLSCLCDGNGYWIKARDGTGAVRELWWAPHDSMRPVRFDPRKPDYRYVYTVRLPGVAEPVVTVLEPSEVVHFKHGPPDPCNDLVACAPLKRCLREVGSDNEVAAYTSSVLWNRGVPGLILVFEDDVAITQDRADQARDMMERNFSGRNRGKTAVMGGKVRIENPAFSPNDMNLNEISRIPEARICAALGIPPAVLGLLVGDQQKSYANYGEAEKQAWRRLRAVQDRMAEALYRQLLPDFRPDRTRYRVAWDYSRVEALQDDRDATAKRAVLLFQGGVAKRSEARTMVGLAPAEDETDDVYFGGGKAGGGSPGGTGDNSGDFFPEDDPAAGGGKSLAVRAEHVIARIEAELGPPGATGLPHSWSSDLKARGGGKRPAAGKPKPGGGNVGHDGGHPAGSGGQFAPGGGRVPGHSAPNPARVAASPRRSYAGQLRGHDLSSPRPATKSPSPGNKVARPEHDYSAAIESRLARTLGGRPVGRFRGKDTSVDVLLRGGRGGPVAGGPKAGQGRAATRGVECKVLIKGEKQGITMHPDARLRKARYVENRPGSRSVDTVILDHRDTYGGGRWSSNYSGHEIYYKRGADAYKLKDMHKVKDLDELRRLQSLPDGHPDLPAAARAPSGWPPRGEALAKLERQAEVMNAYRVGASRRRREAARG
jgi:HK97 family phage portal protein